MLAYAPKANSGDGDHNLYGKPASFAPGDTGKLHQAIVEGVESSVGYRDLMALSIRNAEVPALPRILLCL